MLLRLISRSLANRQRNTTNAVALRRLLSSVAAASSKEESTAIDMIKYAKSKSLVNDEPSYSEAVRVLQQGLSYFHGDEFPAAMASARLQLSLATVHAHRSNINEASDCLQQLLNMPSAPLITKVAALEALVGLCIEMNQDESAKEHARRLTKLLEGAVGDFSTEQFESLKCQSYALQKLVELASGVANDELPYSSLMDSENGAGAAFLALAEFSHVHGSFETAKNMYERAIELSNNVMEENGQTLSAISMVPEAIKTGALAGLGQLLSVIGHFEDAEANLTKALKLAEKVKGEKHPQVGSILSCIANLYERRALAQERNEILLTEGMYKSSLDLMKAQALDHGADQTYRYSEVIALTRARLAMTLAPARNRQSEVQKLFDCVETTWRKSPPLPEIMYLKSCMTNNSKDVLDEERNKIGQTTLIDVRFGRVFYK